MPVPDNRIVNTLRYASEYLGIGRWIAPFPIRREARTWKHDRFPVQSGEVVKPPDFVGVGTQKSGTSWWASLIEQHPAVVPNKYNRKEMHYLAHFLSKPMTDEDIRTYHSVFARPEGKICGEWTPNYMAQPQALVRLKQAAPDAKLLILLRNPVDRYESGFNHERKQRFGGIIGPSIRLEVIKQYALQAESIWNGMYASQLEIVSDLFPTEQVLTLQYEQCCSDPKHCLEKTYRFLGLDHDFQPQELRKSVNPQKRVTKKLSDELREVLKTIYRPQVRQLVQRYPNEIDLSLWSDFNDE